MNNIMTNILLDKEQNEVVSCVFGKMAVVAAPGSGKTRTLVERTNFLVKNKYAKYDEILLVTFTEKAKLEIIERFEHVSLKPDVETFHSLAYKTISSYNSKYQKKKINIMTTTEENIIDKISMHFSKNNDVSINKNSLKNTFSLCSFDDLLVMFIDLLKNKKNNLANINKYKYIMVDECQDLDLIQYEIVSLIDCENTMLIGDLNQSIYGWRGAKLQLFKDFYNSCQNKFHLLNNYRSGEEIINTSNRLINNNFDKVDVLVNVVNKNDSFAIKEEFEEDEEQISWVVDNIKKEIRNNCSIALIFRCDYQKNKYVDKLLAENIKFNILTTKYEELNDVIAIYKALNGNSLSLFQLAQRLNLKIQDLDIVNIKDENLLYLKKEIDSISNQSTDIVSKIKLVLDKLNFFSKVYLFNNESKRVVDKILELATLKMKKQNRKYQDFGYILTTLTINSLLLNNKDNKDYCVDIMTIHSSKGLEYDYVFMPDVNANLLPHRKGVLEEERRLFYVGITRAKKGVFISSLKKSLFIDEI